ncbi:Protein MAIN-LIKE 1, partial [Camellia lanceoleosa]
GVENTTGQFSFSLEATGHFSKRRWPASLKRWPADLSSIRVFQRPTQVFFAKTFSFKFSEMAGHFPHDGGPADAGGDPDIMALPPRVRPFIPERYAPPAHILPRAIFHQFTDFDRRAPGDLLLREPEYHLSHEAREVTSRTVQGYSSTVARDWYAELPEAVQDLVDLAGFGPFCTGLSRCPARRTLMAALVRQYDWGGAGLATLYCYMSATSRGRGDLLGGYWRVTSRTVRGYGSTVARDWYAEFREAVRDLVDLAGFGPFCTGLSRCPARRTLMAALVERWWDTTNSFHFSAMGDLTMTPLDFAVLTGLDVGGWPIPYDENMGQWEAAWIYLLRAHPPVDRASGRVRYTWFSSHFRRVEMEPGTPEEAAQYARGFLMFLFGTTLFADRGNTLWVYAYFSTLAPEMVVEGPFVTPYSLVFEGQHRPRPQESLLYLRQYFDTVRSTEFAGRRGASQYRILFEGPVGRAWFLGERFLRQVWGYISQAPPSAPPVEMRIADRFSSRDVVNAMLGIDALLYLEEGDYATYHHIYLMPPLTGVRTPAMRSAGMPSSSQALARAANAPSTSRAGTSGGRHGFIPPTPPTYHHPGWPDMATELMGWQYGTTSPIPIPIEPPVPGHRYVRDPESPPPPVEYMDQVLEMVASLEGMVLRREAQLSIMGFQ